MFHFTNKKHTDYRQSTVWLQALQDREDKKIAVQAPPVVEEAVVAQIVHQAVVAPVEAQHVIVTRNELEASKEERQLHSLQEEIADLPTIGGLAFA